MSTPDCLKCGTCCFSTLDRYVAVSGDDYERLGEHAERLVTWIGNRAYMKMHDGHCAALAIQTTRQGSSSDTGGARFVCTIYDERPTTCRALERGSPECEGERATKGERPMLTLARTRGA
jgi:Fe-S-cluster containining protein